MSTHQDAPGSGPDPPRGEHRPQIDGLRFLAFLGVFAFHVNPGRVPAGSLGVPLFFVLSGFLITRILLRNEGPSLAADLATFYARRALRIVPLYYATLLGLQAVGRLDRPLVSYLYLYNLGTYAEGRFLDPNGHLWTLSVEEQFYLIFPILLLATPRARRAALLGGLLVACAASRMALERLAPGPFTHMLTNVAGEYLIAGAIAGYLDVRSPGRAGSMRGLAGAALLCAFVAAWISGVPLGTSALGPILPEIAALAFALLIRELWGTSGTVSRALGARPLAYLGRISYGCYLFHLFALQGVGALAEAWGLDAMPVLFRARSAVALAITIAAAALSWHLFEAPILSLKSHFRYGGGPDAQAARWPSRRSSRTIAQRVATPSSTVT